MLLVKVNANTIEQVVAQCKYASKGMPKNVKTGEIILIAQTINSLKKDEKSIRYAMYYDKCYEDINGESQKLWGQQWKYILQGYGIKPIRPFNIKEIQVSKQNYDSAVNYAYLLKEDEEIVLKQFSLDAILNLPAFPDELPDKSTEYYEGKKKTVFINTYERNPKARQECINHYGVICCICGFDFGKTYGCEFNGKIHIHHLKMISEFDREYIIDPVEDLRPVCPNCHMIIHSRELPYTIEEVKSFLR